MLPAPFIREPRKPREPSVSSEYERMRTRCDRFEAETGVLREMVNYLLDSPTTTEGQILLRKELRRFVRERDAFYRALRVHPETLRALAGIATELHKDGRLETTIIQG